MDDSLISSIENAICYLSTDNNIIDSFICKSNGFYISNIKAQEGKNYSIKVSVPGFNNVTSESYIPQKPIILNINQKDFVVPDLYNAYDGMPMYPFSRISVKFTDPAEEANYYEFKMKFFDNWQNSENPSYDYISFQVTSYDSIIKNENILDYNPRILVFSDSLFNGQTKTIDFLYKFGNYSTSNKTELTYGKYRIYYQFRTISKQMYDYRKSLIKHITNQQGDILEIYADPVPMYNNIKNGYGIFAGYSEINDTIYVDKSYYTLNK